VSRQTQSSTHLAKPFTNQNRITHSGNLIIIFTLFIYGGQSLMHNPCPSSFAARSRTHSAHHPNRAAHRIRRHARARARDGGGGAFPGPQMRATDVHPLHLAQSSRRRRMMSCPTRRTIRRIASVCGRCSRLHAFRVQRVIFMFATGQNGKGAV
jgi:hypothetical protein